MRRSVSFPNISMGVVNNLILRHQCCKKSNEIKKKQLWVLQCKCSIYALPQYLHVKDKKILGVFCSTKVCSQKQVTIMSDNKRQGNKKRIKRSWQPRVNTKEKRNVRYSCEKVQRRKRMSAFIVFKAWYTCSDNSRNRLETFLRCFVLRKFT